MSKRDERAGLSEAERVALDRSSIFLAVLDEAGIPNDTAILDIREASGYLNVLCPADLRRLLEIADRLTAAIARAEAAEARHQVAHQQGHEIVCSCGVLRSNYGLTRTLVSVWAQHVREARAALTTERDLDGPEWTEEQADTYARAAMGEPDDQERRRMRTGEDAEVWVDVDGDYPEVPTEAAEVRWPTDDQEATE